MDIVTKAKEFASHTHKDHTRNDEEKTPYIFHLAEVAELVTNSGGTDEEIASAWLHDTVEDTQTTIEDVRKEFGKIIGEIVYGLTDLPEWNSLPLGERKAKQVERIARENDNIKRVKLADQTSNVKIVGFGSDFFTLDDKFIYLEGARRIAKACKGVSDFLDKTFEERYNDTLHNLKAIQELRKQ